MDSASVVQKGFKRDLSGLQNCAFSALANPPAELITSQDEVNTVLPHSPKDLPSLPPADTSVLPSGTSPGTRTFVENPVTNAVPRVRSWVLRQPSLRAAAAYAWGTTAEEAWEHPSASSQPASGDSVATNIEAETRK